MFAFIVLAKIMRVKRRPSSAGADRSSSRSPERTVSLFRCRVATIAFARVRVLRPEERIRIANVVPQFLEPRNNHWRKRYVRAGPSCSRGCANGPHRK